MNKSPVQTIMLYVLCCGIGLFGGWYAANQTRHGGGHGAHEEAADAGHDDHAGHGDESAGISKQAQLNMGIVIKEIESEDFWVSAPVPAQVEASIKNDYPIAAFLPGRIQAIYAEKGQVVKAGDPILTYVRDAIARPDLLLVGQMLNSARVKIAIQIIAESSNRRKLSKEFSSLGLPSALGPQLKAAGRLSAQQALLYQAILKENGVWRKDSDRLFAVLPPLAKQNPLVISAMGELAAGGFLTEPVVQWFVSSKEAKLHVPEIVRLLQDGYGLARIDLLSRAGYLEDTVTITAPFSPGPANKDQAIDYDVEDIPVRIGQFVNANDLLAQLVNPRSLYLIAKPVGSEMESLNKALQLNYPVAASSLIKGNGPALSNLNFLKIMSNHEGTQINALFHVENTPLKVTTTASGAMFRTWSLRAGLKYMVRVPIKKVSEAMVVPREAVVDDGAEKVVYVQNGKQFTATKVEVTFQDDQIAVLGENSDLFPGDPVVVEGAFALDLALKAASGQGVDPHAGHNH